MKFHKWAAGMVLGLLVVAAGLPAEAARRDRDDANSQTTQFNQGDDGKSRSERRSEERRKKKEQKAAEREAKKKKRKRRRNRDDDDDNSRPER